MSEKVLHNALLPFYSTKQKGSGLGLPLCREIVEAHGGNLSLSNRRSGGLRVEFSIPRHAEIEH
jgi:signal transduction histidine kinase